MNMMTTTKIPGYDLPIQLDLEEGLLIIDGEKFTCLRLMNYLMWKEDGLAQMFLDIVHDKICIMNGYIYMKLPYHLDEPMILFDEAVCCEQTFLVIRHVLTALGDLIHMGNNLNFGMETTKAEKRIVKICYYAMQYVHNGVPKIIQHKLLHRSSI